MLWTLLIVLGGAYFGLALVLFLLQSRLVHLPHIPGRELTATPDQVGLSYETVEFVTEDEIKLHGWYVPARECQGTLLFFHGNAGNISHRLDSLKIFNEFGLNSLIFDYRGYGRSTGKPSEQGLYRDAEAALRYLRVERDTPLSMIVFFGRSLGGSLAAWLAARQPPAALILESTFTSAQDMAAELYPFLPTRWLTRLRYDTHHYLQGVKSPVLIIHSQDDEIVPYEHGRRLFAAASEPKRLLTIRGGHNEGFLTSGQRYREGIRDFLSWQKVTFAPSERTCSASYRVSGSN